jgi:hypothetical protein
MPAQPCKRRNAVGHASPAPVDFSLENWADSEARAPAPTVAVVSEPAQRTTEPAPSALPHEPTEAPVSASTGPLLTADFFAGWVLRADASGRLGWESPALTEESRWWARRTFDQLPFWLPPWPPANETTSGQPQKER